jgi:hypothetical protein
LIFEAYGFGHYLEKLPNGMLSVSQGGQGNVIMTHLQAVTETGDAIVILTNSCIFRPHPDTDSGNIRTAFRNYPDSITAYPDTLSND